MSLKVYGIPTCSTCKRSQQWLQARGIEHEFINTKEHPPDRQTIAAWVSTLGSKPMRNTSGQSYRALGDEKKGWTEQQWIDAFAKDAMLLKRPLFVRDKTAILVGFSAPETTLQEKLADG
jgi:arsenate reductase (glutaredoxin)